jgi:hypothetical protein
VASRGIEPRSGASETLILSIVLRGRFLNIVHLFTKKATARLLFLYGVRESNPSFLREREAS